MGAGALVGAIIGGAYGYTTGLVGFALFNAAMTGMSLGSLFDRPKSRSSAYDPEFDVGNTMSQRVPVPVVYGRHKVTGNIIYRSEPGPKAVKNGYATDQGDHKTFLLEHSNILDDPMPVVYVYTKNGYIGRGAPNFIWVKADPTTYSIDAASGRIVFNNPIELNGGAKRSVKADFSYKPTSSKKLDLCVGLSEGPIFGVESVTANDIPIESVLDATYNVYLGTDGQTPDPRNKAENFKHLAYVACSFEANRQISDGQPTISAIVLGRLVDVWNGSLWVNEYSRNNAYCLLDLLRNTRYGMGIPDKYINFNSFIDAADYCDEILDDGEPRYRLDIDLDAQKEALDWVEQILLTFNAFLTYADGQIHLRVQRSDTPVQAFDMDNIVNGSFSYQIAQRKDIYNKFKVEFIDPDNPNGAWQMAPIIADDEIDQQRTGIRQKDIQLVGVIRPFQAGRQAAFFRDSAKRCRTFCRFKAGIYAIQCQVGDVISVTHTLPGWVNKQFRIISMEELENDEVSVTCREHDPRIYHDRAIPYDPQPITTLPNPWGPPETISNLVVEETGWLNSDGVYIAGLNVSFDTPDSFSSAHIELSSDNGTTWGYVNNITSSSYRIEPLRVGVTYMVRVKTISTKLSESAPVTSGFITIVGKTEPPPKPTAFSVSPSVRGLVVTVGSYAIPTDFKTFEIHVSKTSDFLPTGWDGSAWVSTPNNTAEWNGNDKTLYSVSPVTPNSLTGLEGETTYYVRIVAVDTSDNRSVPSDPVQATTTKLTVQSENYEPGSVGFQTFEQYFRDFMDLICSDRIIQGVDVSVSEVQHVLYPTDDAYTDTINPSANYGSSSALRVFSYTYNPNQGVFVWVKGHSFLKWNLAGITGAAYDVQFQINLYSVNNNTNRVIDLCQVTSPWSESTVTNNNKPSWGSAILSKSPKSSGTLTFEGGSLPDLVNGWISGSIANNGLALVLAGSLGATASFDIRSREYISNKPVLKFKTSQSPGLYVDVGGGVVKAFGRFVEINPQRVVLPPNATKWVVLTINPATGIYSYTLQDDNIVAAGSMIVCKVITNATQATSVDMSYAIGRRSGVPGTSTDNSIFESSEWISIANGAYADWQHYLGNDGFKDITIMYRATSGGEIINIPQRNAGITVQDNGTRLRITNNLGSAGQFLPRIVIK